METAGQSGEGRFATGLKGQTFRHGRVGGRSRKPQHTETAREFQIAARPPVVLLMPDKCHDARAAAFAAVTDS